MKLNRFLILFVLIALYSCVRNSAPMFENQNESNSPAIGYSLSSDCDIDVASIHNEGLGAIIGSMNIEDYQTYLDNFSESQIDSSFLSHVSITRNKIFQETGFLVNYDTLAVHMYNNLVFVSNIPDFKMTYHLLDSLGYSNESIVILLKLDSLVDLYGTDSLMFLQNASILKNQISTINNDFEQCIVAKAIELGIATNKFWNEHNNLIHGSVLYRKGPNNVQKADIVGFVTGAWEGAKWGAVAAGGIPGAIAGGLLGGAASSLGASAWAYFLPNAWWNPWA